MNYIRWLYGFAAAVTTFCYSTSAYANAAPYQNLLLNQIPDVFLTTGMSAYTVVTTQRYSNPSYAENDVGLYALSNIPGLSVQQSYGGPETMFPPFTWAPVGVAGPMAISPYGRSSIARFFVSFDGTAPAGTSGTIDIAVNSANDTSFVPEIIGRVNVFVGATGVTPTATWFTIAANASNLSAGRIMIDNQYSNAHSAMPIFVTHVINSSSPADSHGVYVSYDQTVSRWFIAHQDGTPILVKSLYNVRIDPSAYSIGFPRFGGSSSVKIDNYITNGDPYAVVSVTQASSADNHPLSVKYIAPYWYIINSDNVSIPAQSAFNYQLFAAGGYDLNDYPGSNSDQYDGNGVGISYQQSFRTIGDTLTLDFWWQFGQSSLPLIATTNQNPLSPFGTTTTTPLVVDIGNLAVRYSPTGFTAPGYPSDNHPGWQIVHENGSPITSHSSFNVWGPAHQY